MDHWNGLSELFISTSFSFFLSSLLFFELLKISFLDGWMVIRSRGKLPDFGEMILLDLIGVVKNNS